MTWWAVAIDNEAVGEAQWGPEGVPLKPNPAPPNEDLVRSGHLTSTRNGFVALRCSAKADDSDSAVRLALDYYERYVGERVTKITRVAAGPEGDLNMGSKGGGSSGVREPRRPFPSPLGGFARSSPLS